MSGTVSAEDFSDWFWDIVARAERDRSKLESILRTLSDDDLYRFELEFRDAASSLPYGAFNSYLQLSEDGHDDLSYWVVSQGKEYYRHIAEHPEAVVAFAEANDKTLGFEFTAVSILEERLGEDVWEDVSHELERFADSGYGRVADYWMARRQERRRKEHETTELG